MAVRPRRLGPTAPARSGVLADWRRDLVRNARSAKGRIVLSLFRAGVALPLPARRLYRPLYYVVVDMLLGISLPLEARVGGGLLLRHGQGVVVSWRSALGEDCELHQNVTLGERNGGAPRLGDRVVVGANAVLLGGIVVGDGARVGAGAVVLRDVPAGATAVGNPARIVAARTALGT